MQRVTLAAIQRLQGPLYAVGALMICLPMLDLAANVWPLRPASLEWRFGTLGLLSGFTLTPLLGMIIVSGTIALLEHRRALRVSAVIYLVLAVMLLAGTGLFVLDVLQFRPNVPEAAVSSFQIGAWKSVVKHVAVTGALAWLGHASWRAGRPHRPA